MNDPEYERMYRIEDTYWWFVARHRLVENLVRSRYGKPGEKPLDILDAGCGTGAMSARLAPFGRVVSVDYSPLALTFSRRRGLRHLLGADAMRLPIRSESLDLVVCMDVLEHLPDDHAAVSEFFRVLRPGGRVIATVPAYPHLWSEHDIALMHKRRYLRPQFRCLFTEAGFEIEKMSHTMSALYPVVDLQRRLNAHRLPHDPPEAAMPMLPRPLNSLLIGLLGAENYLAQRADFPFGVTILTVAAKPQRTGAA